MSMYMTCNLYEYDNANQQENKKEISNQKSILLENIFHNMLNK